jgi:hypothetical protein
LNVACGPPVRWPIGWQALAAIPPTRLLDRPEKQTSSPLNHLPGQRVASAVTVMLL